MWTTSLLPISGSGTGKASAPASQREDLLKSGDDDRQIELELTTVIAVTGTGRNDLTQDREVVPARPLQGARHLRHVRMNSVLGREHC